MGRRGPLPAREDRPSGVTVITHGPRPPATPVVTPQVPDPPPGLLAESRNCWTEFWTSGAAQWVDRRAHMSRLVRWIHDVDRWHRVQRDLRPSKPRPWPRPEAPADLSDDARAVWDRTVASGRRFGNVDLLRTYCETVARYRKASATLEQTGPLSQAINGAIGRSPLHQIVLDNAAMMRQLARELDLDAEASADQRVPGVFDSTRPWLALGSTGQITRHPSSDELDKLDARIHRAEVEFGMTPYAGVRLGLAGVQGALTAEQLSRLVAERGAHEPDPREEEWAGGFTPA